MSREIYPQTPRDANADLPRRAGELLPELFQRYMQRAIVAQGSPAEFVGEPVPSPDGISIVIVKSAGRAVATSDLFDPIAVLATPQG